MVFLRLFSWKQTQILHKINNLLQTVSTAAKLRGMREKQLERRREAVRVYMGFSYPGLDHVLALVNGALVLHAHIFFFFPRCSLDNCVLLVQVSTSVFLFLFFFVVQQSAAICKHQENDSFKIPQNVAQVCKTDVPWWRHRQKVGWHVDGQET